MPAPTQWKAADLTPAVIKASDGSIRTVTGQRDGSRPGDSDDSGSVGVIFSENFNDQPDWTSTSESLDNTQLATTHSIPDGWYGIYQTTQWSPETGHSEKHASMEILASNTDKTRSGSGKSAVFWRESYSFGDGYHWASDAQFVKVLENDHQEIYVEFYVRFSDEWYQRGKDFTAEGWEAWQSKIFRVGYWDRDGSIWNSFGDGDGGSVNPRMFWGYKVDSYGTRNTISAFQGPPTGSSKSVTDLGGSLNFIADTDGQEVGGTNPQLPDLVNGGLLRDSPTLISHEQVYGSTEVWTKIAFRVKMNSAPGVKDGVLSQWMNGHRILHNEAVDWINTDNDKPVTGWNFIAIGGNDFFRPYPDANKFEDWWALDDLVVRDSLPEELT